MGGPETASGAAARSDQQDIVRAEAPPGGPPAKSNLAVRLLTAGILAPLLLVLLFLGPVWGWALLLSLSAGQVAWELLSMTHPADRFARGIGAGVTACVTGGVFLGAEEPGVVVSLLGVTALVMPLVTLFRLGDISTAALRLLGGLAAPLYVGVTFACLALLRTASEGRALVFLTLTIAWMGDTGGYTFGRLFGKTKLYPEVSPKKTREGLLGSVVFATAAAAGASLSYLPQLPLLHGVLLGGLGALLGQAGDLVESLIKRSTGVKDSGSILPGHGGLFDRVDALLVVSVLVYLYALWT